ncbi:universal stress protein [Haloarcula sp. Atlit-7R]|uniref:universal stress protein n=1 Tax=Haloarcula sp. Atlit-7R TaxID=2282125 RepID=UPI000EF1577D|nr:universal stress protein [Haloarcula sp. Atlit-7R]RLM89083.1 universal stress protein [Haloarcula sp. Atlit-7R]
MFDRIIIAVDGSAEAKHAARRGIDLAKVVDASVDVLHVVPRKSLRLTQTADEQSRVRDRGEDVLSEIEELASDRDYPITTTLSEGKPAARISEYAADQNADLMAIGRQGMTGLGKRLLGGVTEQVLHQSDVPVFVIPDGDRVSGEITEYGRMLILTDGSENAEEVTQYGAAIAQPYDSDVHVLNVVDLQAAGGAFNAGGLEKEFIERLDTQGQEAVDRVVTEIEDTRSDFNILTAVERTNSFEGAAAGICEYVDNNQINLVVMGSHGRSNLRRQLLGSVASTVLRTVDVPVLIAKRSA